VLTKDISTLADIAPSALETVMFCFMGCILVLTYYLLLDALRYPQPMEVHKERSDVVDVLRANC